MITVLNMNIPKYPNAKLVGGNIIKIPNSYELKFFFRDGTYLNTMRLGTALLKFEHSKFVMSFTVKSLSPQSYYPEDVFTGAPNCNFNKFVGLIECENTRSSEWHSVNDRVKSTILIKTVTYDATSGTGGGGGGTFCTNPVFDTPVYNITECNSTLSLLENIGCECTYDYSELGGCLGKPDVRCIHGVYQNNSCILSEQSVCLHGYDWEGYCISPVENITDIVQIINEILLIRYNLD